MMATYEFQSESGETIERQYPMAQAPPIGTEIEVDGVKFRRIASSSVGLAQVATAVHGYPYQSMQIAGQPWIRSQTHEREMMAELGRERD